MHVDDLKVDFKTLLMTGVLLFVAISIGMAGKPIYIDYYFSFQPVRTIQETIPGPDSDMLFGETVVIEGRIIENTLEDMNGNKVTIQLTDKLNCIPKQNQAVRIAGAYNPDPDSTSLKMYPESVFYAVWVVGGCG